MVFLGRKHMSQQVRDLTLSDIYIFPNPAVSSWRFAAFCAYFEMKRCRSDHTASNSDQIGQGFDSPNPISNDT